MGGKDTNTHPDFASCRQRRFELPEPPERERLPPLDPLDERLFVLLLDPLLRLLLTVGVLLRFDEELSDDRFELRLDFTFGVDFDVERLMVVPLSLERPELFEPELRILLSRLGPELLEPGDLESRTEVFPPERVEPPLFDS